MCSHALFPSVPKRELEAWSIFGVMSVSPGPFLRSSSVSLGWTATCCSEPRASSAGAKVVDWTHTGREQLTYQPNIDLPAQYLTGSPRGASGPLWPRLQTRGPRWGCSGWRIPQWRSRSLPYRWQGFLPGSHHEAGSPFHMACRWGSERLNKCKTITPDSSREVGRVGYRPKAWGLGQHFPLYLLGDLLETEPAKEKYHNWRARSSHLSQMLSNTTPHDPRAVACDEEESGGLCSRWSHSTHAHFRESSSTLISVTLCLQQPGRQLRGKQAGLRPQRVVALWHTEAHASLEAIHMLFNFFFQFYWDIIDTLCNFKGYSMVTWFNIYCNMITTIS